MPSSRRIDADLRDAEIKSFKQKQHSLRISVSNLAALVGLHPFKQVPELVQQLVYQGTAGQMLLEHDAKLLGLSLVSPEEELKKIARKAGSATEKALRKALTATTDSVEIARVVKEAVVKEAEKTGRLLSHEIMILQEGVRSSVDTMHGTCHEDAALNAYEQLTGWTVRERNSQIRALAFCKSHNGIIPTVFPIGQASSPLSNADSEQEVACFDSVKESEEKSRCARDGKRLKKYQFVDDDKGTFENSHADSCPTQFPFFFLLGSIDGLRDELAPNDAHGDDDSWRLRPVVVECKHRMKRIHKVPPLHEQIQAVAYCFLYDTEHADLIQVMREDSQTEIDREVVRQNSDSNKATSMAANKDPAASEKDRGYQSTLLKYFGSKEGDENDPSTAREIGHGGLQRSSCSGNMSVVAAEEISNTEEVSRVENGDAITVLESSKIASKEVDEGKSTLKQPLLAMTVSRVSLDDPIYQHRSQWQQMVLPRLRSIVEATYRIRGDDQKRHELLNSLGTDDGLASQAAWEIIFAECPWMRQCETAHRQFRTNRTG